MEQYTRDSKITFGKYKGKTVAEVIEADAQYILWFNKNIDTVKLSKTAVKLAKRRVYDSGYDNDMIATEADIY